MFRGRAGGGARRSARAMTLVEMVIAVVLIGASLFLLVGWTNAIRTRAKIALARRVLVELDRALIRYYESEKRYPVSPDAESDPTPIADALWLHRTSRDLKEAVPKSLWSTRGRRTLLDPWGRPLRYRSSASRSPDVETNENRPIFESAGPDGDFGDDDPQYQGDNLRSDDPDKDGFRESASPRA